MNGLDDYLLLMCVLAKITEIFGALFYHCRRLAFTVRCKHAYFALAQIQRNMCMLDQHHAQRLRMHMNFFANVQQMHLHHVAGRHAGVYHLRTIPNTLVRSHTNVIRIRMMNDLRRSIIVLFLQSHQQSLMIIFVALLKIQVESLAKSRSMRENCARLPRSHRTPMATQRARLSRSTMHQFWSYCFWSDWQWFAMEGEWRIGTWQLQPKHFFILRLRVKIAAAQSVHYANWSLS